MIIIPPGTPLCLPHLGGAGQPEAGRLSDLSLDAWPTCRQPARRPAPPAALRGAAAGSARTGRRPPPPRPFLRGRRGGSQPRTPGRPQPRRPRVVGSPGRGAQTRKEDLLQGLVGFPEEAVRAGWGPFEYLRGPWKPGTVCTVWTTTQSSSGVQRLSEETFRGAARSLFGVRPVEAGRHLLASARKAPRERGSSGAGNLRGDQPEP